MAFRYLVMKQGYSMVCLKYCCGSLSNFRNSEAKKTKKKKFMKNFKKRTTIAPAEKVEKMIMIGFCLMKNMLKMSVDSYDLER